MATTEQRNLRSGESIKAVLKQFSLEHKINELLLDYKLVSFQTYLVAESSAPESGEAKAPPEKIPIETSQISAHFSSTRRFSQKYTIEIFKRQNSFYPILIQLHSNDTHTELNAHIYTERIPQNADLEAIIKQTIVNICAYRGIIIGLGWRNISKDIADIAAKLRSPDAKPEFYEINIAKLKEPRATSLAVKLIISKSAKVSVLSHNSLLLSGGFFRVTRGEILLEYTKPSYAFPWRDIYGNIYGVGAAYPVGIEAGLGVKIQDAGEKIHYLADADGFVSIVGSVMLISDTVTLDNVNAKNLENINEQKLDSLVINNDNLTKDVVAPNLALNVATLRIVGNVGAASITADDLSINGQVHIKAKIAAKKASILHFKGHLEAQNASIRYCENATVYAQNLSINYANGSKIYCQNGKISQVKSNNFFFVQGSLVVGQLKGENNEFILYPCLFGEAKTALEVLKTKQHNIDRLRRIFIDSSGNLEHDYTRNRLLYEKLVGKNGSFSGRNIHSWERNVIGNQSTQLGFSERILKEYANLMATFSAQEAGLRAEIRAMLDKMFEIQVVFSDKCTVGFYVTFVNFYDAEHRFHINANETNPIKKIRLSPNKQDSIKILCYKD